MTWTEERPGSHGISRALLAACAGGCLLVGVLVVAGGRPVELEEPLALRWVRQAAEHPWRTGAGGALVAGGLLLARRRD